MTPDLAGKTIMAIALAALLLLAGLDVAGRNEPWWPLYGLCVVLFVMGLVPWFMRRRRS